MQLSTHRLYICLVALAAFPLTVAAQGGLGEVFSELLRKATVQLAQNPLADPKKVVNTLREVAAEVNPTLPVFVDKATRLDKIIPGPGAKLTYSYTIATRKSKEIDHQYLLNFLRKNLKTQACASEDLKIFFENKVIVGYSYKSSDDIHIGTLEVTPRDCGYAS
jgi:hypothetical protein